jgi:hypothetical protein
MRRRLTLALIILNCLLGLGVLAQYAGTQVLPLSIFNCCKGGPDGYCCKNCCWFTQNCTGDGECQQTVTGATG